MNLLLRRTETSDAGTFGEMYDEDEHLVGVTVELPWRDNQTNVSCIPAGEYPVWTRQAGESAQVPVRALRGWAACPDGLAY